jgi:homoprotocatechuate degradation regulator HpaR
MAEPRKSGRASGPPSLYDIAPREGWMRPFERSLPMALLRAREAVMRGFRAMLRRYGLNEQEWRIIRALVEVDRLEIGELADRVFILKPSATRTVRNLQSRGIVARNRSPSDQRRAYISLTEEGRHLFETVAPNSEAEYARLTELVGERDIHQLYELLSRLSQALGAEPRDDPFTPLP